MTITFTDSVFTLHSIITRIEPDLAMLGYSLAHDCL